MTAATAVSWVFAGLLVMAGARKVASPAATGAALQGARLPSDRRLVRLLGAGEVVLAVLVFAVGGVAPAVLLALVYATFAVFSHRQSSRGAGCGCFSDSDAPATGLHVAVDAAGAVVAAVAAWRPGPSLLESVLRDPVTAALALVLLGTAVVAVRLTLTALPELAVAASLDAGEGAA